MRNILLCFGVVLCLVVFGCSDNQCSGVEGIKGEPMLAHNVFFTLKDDSDVARADLVEACHKYLKDHPGVVFFAAGSLAEDMDREVNDRDFHVGLHVVFKSQEYQDRYQVAEKHLQFIEENKDNWAKVRVFDSVVR